jgi:ParB family chromosome partitioning protein
MADRSGQTFEIPKSSSLVADVFSTLQGNNETNREKVMEIPLSDISDFPNHPFKVKMDDEMHSMVGSIKQYGILVPGLVRPKDGGGYEMVSGHRRKTASALAELNTMPCIIRNLTDNEAVIIMVDSNLQREKILPSEKAFAYKMKMDAMRLQQGTRTDLTSAPLGQKLNGKTSRELLSEESPDSHSQIQRYIRLTELIPQLLDMVDNAVVRDKENQQIALRPAVELSYLSQEQQSELLEEIVAEDRTPSHDQAIKMRKLSEDGQLNESVIHSIMREEKPNQVEHFKMRRDRISRFFAPDTPAQKIEETIVKALELLRQRERSRNGEAR